MGNGRSRESEREKVGRLDDLMLNICPGEAAFNSIFATELYQEPQT